MSKKPASQVPETLQLLATANFVQAAAGEEKSKRPTFEMLANTGGAMNLMWWSYPVVLDLEGVEVESQQLPARRNHDPNKLVGHSTSITIDDKGIRVSGVISFENEWANEIVTSAANGFAWQVSVGADPRRTEFVEANTTVTVNKKSFKGPLYVVRSTIIKEFSFVDSGADSKTSSTIAASQTTTPMKKKITNADGSVTEVDEPETPTPNAGNSDIHNIVEAARVEQVRRDKIAAMVKEAIAKPNSDLDALKRIGTEAVSAGWSEQTTELAILRASRAQAPAVHTQNSQVITNEILAAQLLLSLGMKEDKLVKDRDFGERVVEAAWKRKNASLHSIMADVLRASGVHAPHGGAELFRACMENHIRAAFSTVSLPGILGSVGNKLLLEAFTNIAVVFPRIAQQSDFQNFLTYTQYRLSDAGGFTKVGQDGELKSGSLSEESYTNKLETSGKMLTLTRQQVINDDLNALQSMYKLLGRAAALAVEEATLDAIMESSDVLFTSARKNKQTTSALSVTTLGTAEALMLKQLGADSKPIYATPAILLVPPELKPLALQLYSSTELVGGSTAAPSKNPFAGRFRVETSPYLAVSSMTGYSATTWYLLAEPELLPLLQVAYLRGQRQPTIETADAAFNTLGVQMRCYFDFGVAAVDYRGGVKSEA